MFERRTRRRYNNTKKAIRYGVDTNGNKCEWCGMEYPKGTYIYWIINVFKDTHTICDDCKEHLKKID